MLKKKVEELEQQLAQRQQELVHKVTRMRTDAVWGGRRKKAKKRKKTKRGVKAAVAALLLSVTHLLFPPDRGGGVTAAARRGNGRHAGGAGQEAGGERGLHRPPADGAGRRDASRPSSGWLVTPGRRPGGRRRPAACDTLPFCPFFRRRRRRRRRAPRCRSCSRWCRVSTGRWRSGRSAALCCRSRRRV